MYHHTHDAYFVLPCNAPLKEETATHYLYDDVVSVVTLLRCYCMYVYITPLGTYNDSFFL